VIHLALILNWCGLPPPPLLLLLWPQGYVVGAGLSGVGTAALSFFSQLGARAGAGGERDPSDVAWAGAIYFGSAAAVTALCAFCYTALNKLPYSRAKLLPYLAGGVGLEGGLLWGVYLGTGVS
jgi:hypothetical protein